MPGPGRRTTGRANRAAGLPRKVLYVSNRVGEYRPLPAASSVTAALCARPLQRARAAAVDELQVGDLPHGSHDRGAAGASSARAAPLHQTDRGAHEALARWTVADAGDLGFVAHQPDEADPGPRGDLLGQPAGLRDVVHGRAAHADVHPSAERAPRGVEVDADPDGRPGLAAGGIRSSWAGSSIMSVTRARDPRRRPARRGRGGRRWGTRRGCLRVLPARATAPRAA